ncbi:hypothetical protein LEM8419_01413 [Neolewinella maritima]|uniref:Type IX secretion system membrane protein PorP/SprF n=1 Tax=Neolewinella maritima TaxID=1383882 RepID=A0ABM9AZI4_9BACT|nr:PorP/SprF family type IX secretion system membrane protein [Neolewinella maritima]CAH1000263.1 hypothetical protein LEM8419_01413 [Neolewinella maritima]
MQTSFTTHLRCCLVLLTVVCFCTCGRAQDVRYSQLHATPLLNNPALTGVMNEALRVTLNYQTHYMTLADTEGFQNVAAAVEVRRSVGRQNFFGLGVQVQHDRAGSSDFVRSQGLLSGSYQQQIADGHYLSGGAQLGVGQRGYDLNKLWFSEQYFVDPVSRAAYIDRSLPSGEPFGGRGMQLYMDVNAGLAYYATLGERRGFYLGGAVYHLTAPNVSPIPEQSDVLARRYVLQGGGELPLGEGDMSILPALRVAVQGPSRSTLVGANLRYTEGRWREVALRFGSYLQFTNDRDDRTGLGAVVAMAGLEYEAYQLGLSYDVIVGALQQVTASRGGFELSMIYTRAGSRRQRVTCPTF